MRAFLAGLAIAIAAVLAMGPAHAAPPLPPSPPAAAAGATIAGFRSAHFGMSEPEIRQAIAADFHLSGSAVATAENPVQRTAVLRIRTTGLIPDGGTAQIDYIFGYRSHRLIEVNILWSAATDPRITPAVLLANGAALQSYFAGEDFAPGRKVMNGILPDGDVLLFRGSDAAGRAVVLVLSGRKAAAPGGTARPLTATLTPTALTLVYAADAAHPDVFRLKKGAF